MVKDLYNQLKEFRNSFQGAADYLGIKITDVKEGWARGEIVINEHHMNPVGAVHGGVIFALADTVGGVAAWSCGQVVTTSNASIQFLNAATEPQRIIAEASALKVGKNLLTFDVRVYDEAGKLLCHATQEYFSLHESVEEKIKR